MYRPHYSYGGGPPTLNQMKPPPPKDSGLPIVPIIIGIVVIVGIIVGIYMYSKRNKSSTTTTSSETVSTTSSSFSTGGGGGGDKAVPDEKMSGSGTVYQQFKSKETNKYLYVKSENTLGVTGTVANADTFNITNGSMKSSKTGLYVKDPNNTGQNPPMTNTGYATDITWDGTYIKVGTTKCLVYDGDSLRIKPCTTNDQSRWIPTIVSSGTVSTTSSSFSTGGGGDIALLQSGGGGGGDKAVPDEKMSGSGTVYQQFKSKETNKYLYVKSDNTLGLIDTVANADTFNITNGSMKSSKTGLYVKDPNNIGQNPPMTNTGYATDITCDGTYIKIGTTKCIMYDGSGLRIKPCTTNDQSRWIPTIISSGTGTGTGSGTPIPLGQYVKFKSVADPTLYINVNTTPNPDRIVTTNDTPSKFAIIGGKFQSQVQTNGANLCAGSGTGQNPKIGACTDQTAVTFNDADGTLKFGNNYLYYADGKLTMGTSIKNYKWVRET